MNKDIINLRENILSALPLSMAKEYERMNRELNTDKEGYYYKTFKKLFDKAFGKDEKGRMIYRKYINVDNMPIDKEIYSFLKDNGYSISEEEFNAGVIIKNKDTLSNKYSLEELQKKGMVLRIGRILNKKKAPSSLILKWDRISKEISNKKLIVISRHPYDIAGQSTDRAWQSCMTLQTDKQRAGSNCDYIDSGIEYGLLIAYLISNDDKNINKPLARVLIKPFTNYDESEIQFKVSKVYGTAGFEFQNAVQKWVNRNLNSRHIKVDEFMAKYDLYLNDDEIYNDNDSYDKYSDMNIALLLRELDNDLDNENLELSNTEIIIPISEKSITNINNIIEDSFKEHNNYNTDIIEFIKQYKLHNYYTINIATYSNRYYFSYYIGFLKNYCNRNIDKISYSLYKDIIFYITTYLQLDFFKYELIGKYIDRELGYSEEEDEIRIYFELNDNTIFIPENYIDYTNPGIYYGESSLVKRIKDII